MFILGTRANQEFGAGEGPDTQSNEVITMPIKSKEPNKSKTNKSNNKTKKNTKTKTKPTRTRQHERQSDILTWPAQLMEDVYCTIEKIGMARNNKTKEQNQEVTSPYKDLWEKQQNPERKPGLPPARSPEITQSRPHGHKVSHTHNLSSHNLSSHNVTSTSRRGTYGTGLALVACSVPTCPSGRRGFLRGRRGTWRHPSSFHVGTWRHSSSFHVAGVVLDLLTRNLFTHNLLTRNLLTHNLHTTCTHTTYSRSRGTWRHGSSLCVAGVARMALGWLWWRARFPRARMNAAAFCVAGVALGDMDRHFAWQAWHVWHWAGSGGALGSHVPEWSPRLFAWQAWHLETSIFVSALGFAAGLGVEADPPGRLLGSLAQQSLTVPFLAAIVASDAVRALHWPCSHMHPAVQVVGESHSGVVCHHKLPNSGHCSCTAVKLHELCYLVWQVSKVEKELIPLIDAQVSEASSIEWNSSISASISLNTSIRRMPLWLLHSVLQAGFSVLQRLWTAHQTELPAQLFFRPSPLSFRQVDQHAIACCMLPINESSWKFCHLGEKMNKKRPYCWRTFTRSNGAITMPNEKPKTKQKPKQTKHKQNQKPNRPNTQRATSGMMKSDPASTVEEIMTCASSNGLVCLFFLPSPLGFRQVDPHAIFACSMTACLH